MSPDLFFVQGLAFNHPKQFIYLCWGSATFVALGALVYMWWAAQWKLVVGSHKHASEDVEHNPNAQQRALENGDYEHDHARFEPR